MSAPTPELNGMVPICGPFYVDLKTEQESLAQAEALFRAKGTRFKTVRTTTIMRGNKKRTTAMLWREKDGLKKGENVIVSGKRSFSARGPTVSPIGRKSHE